MKIALLCLGMITVNTALAQVREGKIVTSSLSSLVIGATKTDASSNGQATVTTKSSSFVIRPEVTFGKIKKNHLFSYGLSFQFTKINQPEDGDVFLFRLSPIVSYKRFFPITQNLFLTPFIRMSLGYEWGHTEATAFSSKQKRIGYGAGIDVNPIGLSFMPNAKYIFFFGFAQMNISYNRSKTLFDPNPANSNVKQSSFALNASVNNINFGIQKYF